MLAGYVYVLVCRHINYLIRPNYCTVRLGFFFQNYWENLWENMYPHILRILLKKSANDFISNDAYAMFLCVISSDFLYKSICCEYSFGLHRQVEAIQMDTTNMPL